MEDEDEGPHMQETSLYAVGDNDDDDDITPKSVLKPSRFGVGKMLESIESTNTESGPPSMKSEKGSPTKGYLDVVGSEGADESMYDLATNENAAGMKVYTEETAKFEEGEEEEEGAADEGPLYDMGNL